MAEISPLRPSRIISTRGEGVRAIARRVDRDLCSSSCQTPTAGLGDGDHGGEIRRWRPESPPRASNKGNMKSMPIANVLSPIKIPMPAIRRCGLGSRMHASGHVGREGGGTQQRQGSSKRSGDRSLSAQFGYHRKSGPRNESRRSISASDGDTTKESNKPKKRTDFLAKQEAKRERAKREALRLRGGV